MESRRIRHIKVGDQEHRAIEMDFEVVTENWNEYKLSNGVKVRVKNVVTKVFVMVDDQDEFLFDENGDLRLIVTGTLNTVSSPGE